MQTLYEKTLKDIIYEIKCYYPDFDKTIENKIKKAFWFAQQAHEGQRRDSGEPYFTHLLGATKILLQLKPDINTICSCLMHDIIEDTNIKEKDIERIFGKNIAQLCNGVSKISKIRFTEEKKEREIESIRKLFLHMAKDIRVIFIKLADRIHNLQTIEFIKPHKKKRIAEESLKIYAPVAERLGIEIFKTQIEDLSFSILETQKFKEIETERKVILKKRNKFISESIKDIYKILSKSNIKFKEVYGREKNVYSIHRKLTSKNYDSLSSLYDLTGLRIIVENEIDCYAALGVIHTYWNPIIRRFKDYIAIPKANGYKSLHTTVLGLAKSKIPTEIQIRTEKMDIDAKVGPASHWRYKLTKNSKHGALSEDYRRSIENTLKVQWDTDSSHNPILTSDRVFVFTPKGEIKDLIRGATVIDFAYLIGNQIGNMCIGSKVNGITKPLDYTLRNGDVIEIVIQNNKNPNPGWIKFAKSKLAKVEIMKYIKESEKDLLSHQIAEEKFSHSKTKTPAAPLTRENQKIDYQIIIGGEEGLSYQMAKCCEPVYKESIIAYNSRGRNFIIHKKNCKTCKLMEQNRFMPCEFVRLRTFVTKAKDRKGFMKDCSETISQEGIFIWDIKFKRLKNNMVKWTFTVQINEEESFKDLLKKMEKIDQVVEITEKK